MKSAGVLEYRNINQTHNLEAAMRRVRPVTDFGGTEWRIGMFGVAGTRSDLTLVCHYKACPGEWTYRSTATMIAKYIIGLLKAKRYSKSGLEDLKVLLQFVNDYGPSVIYL